MVAGQLEIEWICDFPGKEIAITKSRENDRKLTTTIRSTKFPQSTEIPLLSSIYDCQRELKLHLRHFRGISQFDLPPRQPETQKSVQVFQSE